MKNGREAILGARIREQGRLLSEKLKMKSGAKRGEEQGSGNKGAY